MNENPAQPDVATPIWGRAALIAIAAIAAGAIIVMSMPRNEPITPGLARPAAPAPDAQVAPLPRVEAITPRLPGSPGDAATNVQGHETRTLSEPPAGLPVYEGAKLLLGVERKIPHWVQQQVVYRIDDAALDPLDLADWYTQAAERIGWTHKPTAGASPLNRVLVDGRRNMTITVRATDHDARVTFLYREALE